MHTATIWTILLTDILTLPEKILGGGVSASRAVERTRPTKD